MAPGEASPLQALLAVARNMIPDNVVLAAVNMNILGIITFSLFFGICLASLGNQADGFISLITVRTRIPPWNDHVLLSHKLECLSQRPCGSQGLGWCAQPIR